MKIRIKPVYGRIYAYSLLPLILIILGTYAGMYFLSGDSLFVELDEEFHQDEIDHHLLVTNQQANNLEETLDNLESTIQLLNTKSVDIVENDLTSNRQSYFHDVTKDKLTPRPEFSSKYNKSVDFSVSSYFVFPAVEFGNYSASLNDSISETAILDIWFLSLYQTNEDILYMQAYFEDFGIERTYPFNGPIDNNNYNPTNTSMYNLTKNNLDITYHYSNPYLDEFTNQTVISIASPILQDNVYKGYITFTLLLNNIISDLTVISNFQDRAFLINTELGTIFHSSFTSTRDILNETHGLHPITNFESNSSEFVNLFSAITNGEVFFDIITYETDSLDHIVAIKEVKGFIFGLIEVDEATTVIGTFNLIELLLVPLLIIAFIGIIILLLFRRYGFLRNIGLDTLLELEQSVNSKIKEIQEFETDDVGEIVAGKIEEKAENLRTDLGSLDKKAEEVIGQIKNLDKLTAAKLNEQLLRFENRLFMAIDNKFDSIDDLIQNSKGIISISSDQLRSMLNDPQSYISRQMSIFGVSSASTVSQIAELPNEANRLIAILTNLDTIKLEDLATLTNKDPENLRMIISALPDGFGLEMEGDNVKIDKNQILSNLPHLIQIYYQINEHQELDLSSPASQDITRSDPEQDSNRQ